MTKVSLVYLRSQKRRGVTENSTNTDGGKIQSRRKGLSHRDAFRPCSRVSSGGRTSTVGKRTGKVGQKKKTEYIYICIINRS